MSGLFPYQPIELLAPAKTAAIGREAILHGADAVYIGGPSFGARDKAGNAIEDIAALVDYAHRFRARIYVTLNTILHDAELEAARKLAWDCYDAGVDALIVQDMGLLELDLPPIDLHASTQCDIRTPEKARFLADVGFSQLVLARELTIEEIKAVRAAVPADTVIEHFIHGALCVAYSGQCYISHAHTGRSANRGECSQACRLPYDLEDEDGQVLASSRHLLSMKDNNQSANLRALAEAGISSFKIEGRYKDLPYVKNVTAYYRQRLDEVLEDTPQFQRASSGRSTFLFTPQPEKTFNRSATDYFVNGRQADIGAFDSPKYQGEPIGSVARVDKGGRSFRIAGVTPLANGDGLTWFDGKGELQGLRVNRVEGEQVFTAEPLPASLVAGTPLFRNHDHAFERTLERKSAERRVAVSLRLADEGDALRLTAVDKDGVTASGTLTHAREPAREPVRSLDALRDSLGKLGGTMFSAREINVDLPTPWFIPAAVANALRRQVSEALEAARVASHSRPQPTPAVEPPVPYPDTELSYLGKVSVSLFETVR